jgi:anti-sigma-K factor RskA
VSVIMTTRPKQREDDDNVLAAEYALGVMQGAERDAFAARLAAEPALAAKLREWDEHFVQFSDGIAPVAPPPALQTNLQTRLFGKAETAPSFWNRLNLWRSLAFASLAGLLALSTYNAQMTVEPPEAGPALVAQVAGEANAVTLAAYYDEAKGELRLNRVAGNAASGRSFELWLIAGQDAPVSLGVLPADNTTRVIVPEALRAKFKDGVLAISDEPLGGSSTGAPTGAVLATGKLTVI